MHEDNDSVRDGKEILSDIVSKYQFTDEMRRNAQEILAKDTSLLSETVQEKLEKHAVPNWDKFYKRNKANFFKDRRWITREFPELQADHIFEIENLNATATIAQRSVIIVEIGCGVGNAIIPLLCDNPRIRAICVDCSARAIGMLKQRWEEVISFSSLKDQTIDKITPGTSESETEFSIERTDNCKEFSERAPQNVGKLEKAVVLDITQSDLSAICEEGEADFLLLLYTLSAIHPKHYKNIARHCSKLLKPGGILLFRDYGRYDLAQLRFAKSAKAKVKENFYVRYDGTFAYYFDKQDLRDLFCFENQLQEIENTYHLREFTNRKTQAKMPRVLLQAKFRRL